MKLQTNFSFPFDKGVPYLAGLGWGTAVMGFFLLILLLSSGIHFARENPDLKSRLEQIGKSPAEPPQTVSAPAAGDLDNLRRHLKALNSLEAGGGKSVSSILSSMEEILPKGARLVSFQQDQHTGEIQLVVEALGLDDLSKFLAALETDSSFSKVNLIKQSQSQNEKGHWIQFSIELTGNQG